jgi:hypothetical protein
MTTHNDFPRAEDDWMHDPDEPRETSFLDAAVVGGQTGSPRTRGAFEQTLTMNDLLGADAGEHVSPEALGLQEAHDVGQVAVEAGGTVTITPPHTPQHSA